MSKDKYHPQVYYDAHSLVLALAPSHEVLQARRTLLERLRGIIRSTGDRFDVGNVSMLTYAEDLEIAPMELTIIDNNQPAGLSPGTDTRDLPDVYYPSCVAALLQDHGFDGVIQSTDVQRRDHVLVNLKRSDPPPRPEDGAFRWPRYRRSPKPEIVYPPALDATTPKQFRLSLPGPTIRHTLKLLHLYGRINPHLRLLVSLLYVWIRSWDIKEISPMTLCLLLIRFFQEEEVSKLTDAGSETSVSAEHTKARVPDTATAWMQFDTGEGSNKPVMLDISYSLFPLVYPASDFSPLLLRFLRWIVVKKFHKIRTGDDEEWPIFRINYPNVIDGEYAGEIRTFDETRLPWSRHQLIVPDPFVPTHNHAFNVHRSTLHYLSVLGETCGSLLSTGHPLHTIFGPYYQPGILAEQCSRSRSPSPSPLLPKGFNSPIGIRMERPRYSSNLRLQEELMKLYQATVPGPQHEVREKRQRTVGKIASSIAGHFGPAYRVEAFGSTQYGVDGLTSDLDLVVIDPDRIAGFTPNIDLSSLPRIYKIREVSKVLQRSGFKVLQTIPAAAVPIVKFQDPNTGIQCDLNVNDQLGSINTSLIRHYCDILPVLRPLLLAIKRWARPLGYNNPSGALGMPVTFSSYALAIMTIGLLQTRGLLPNLQEGDDLPEGKIFWLRTKEQERIRCDGRWKKFSRWRPSRMVEVEQALQDWFQYWGHEHDYCKTLLSIRWGGVVPREAPCNVEQSESLRDGPFSGFRPPSNLRLEKGGAAKAGSRRKQGKKEALLVADVEVLEGQKAKERQVSGAAGNRIDGTPVTGVVSDEDRDADDEFNATGSEAKSDLSEDEDDLGFTPEADDNAQPPRWQSEMLCVPDPFFRAKNLAGPIRPHVVVHFREDCQRAVMRLRMGGNLNSLLWFDPRTRPPSPPPQPRRRRQQQSHRGAQDGGDRNRARDQNKQRMAQEAT